MKVKPGDLLIFAEGHAWESLVLVLTVNEKTKTFQGYFFAAAKNPKLGLKLVETDRFKYINRKAGGHGYKKIC